MSIIKEITMVLIATINCRRDHRGVKPNSTDDVVKLNSTDGVVKPNSTDDVVKPNSTDDVVKPNSPDDVSHRDATTARGRLRTLSTDSDHSEQVPPVFGSYAKKRPWIEDFEIPAALSFCHKSLFN